ncbi:MAG: hypothetical protein AAGD86_04910 [Pseudomonadota bacterium]
MSDDKLLKTLGKAARDAESADRLDARWERLSAGELSDAELAELLADPAQPEGAEEAFRPLGEDFRAELAARAAATLEAAPEAPAPDNTVAFPPRRRRTVTTFALAATVVLGVALTLRLLPGPQDVPPLPGYSTTLQGGSAYRSDPQPDAVPTFQPDDRLELRLTPDTAVEGELDGLAVAPHPQNLKLFNDLQLDVAPSGAARVVGRIGDQPGEYRLLVAIGRAGALPDEAALAAALGSADTAAGPGWQAWAYALIVAP